MSALSNVGLLAFILWSLVSAPHTAEKYHRLSRTPERNRYCGCRLQWHSPLSPCNTATCCVCPGTWVKAEGDEVVARGWLPDGGTRGCRARRLITLHCSGKQAWCITSAQMVLQVNNCQCSASKQLYSLQFCPDLCACQQNLPPVLGKTVWPTSIKFGRQL